MNVQHHHDHRGRESVHDFAALLRRAAAGTVWLIAVLTPGIGFAASKPATPNSHVLSVVKTGTGTGTVKGGGINCGAACTSTEKAAKKVTLSANPSSDSTFVGWRGACSGTGSCKVTMNGAVNVSAMFNRRAVEHALTISITGKGTVQGAASDCRSTGTKAKCSPKHPEGTRLSLSALAATGQMFTGWTGACAGTSSTCTVDVKRAMELGATFKVLTEAQVDGVQFSPSNAKQYQPVNVTIRWSAGKLPASLRWSMANVEGQTIASGGQTTMVRFTPLGVGSQAWQLFSGTKVIQSGSVQVASAPDFVVRPNTPSYHPNPPTKDKPEGRGFCRPQCAEWVQAQLDLKGGRGLSKEFWARPYEGYRNYGQGNSTRPPRPGDILVFGGTIDAHTALCKEYGGCGHVAIVRVVDLASGSLIRTDTNMDGKCSEGKPQDHHMIISRDPTTGNWSISGPNSQHLLGWQSKD